MNTYEPEVVSAPGETLAEVLVERGMTQRELAERMGVQVGVVSRLIHGRQRLTEWMAWRLEHVLGIPYEFWLRYEVRYRNSLEAQR